MNDHTNKNRASAAIIYLLKRWSLVFLLIFTLITGVDAASALLGSGSTGGSVLFRLVFAAVASVIVNIVISLFIAPRMNKKYRIFRGLVMRIAEDGYSETLIDEMEKELTSCLADKEHNRLYISQYAMFLGEAYISLHRYDEAEEKLNMADMEYMERAAENKADLNAQQNMIMLHVLLIQLCSARKDVGQTEKWLSSGEKYFSRMRGKNDWVNYFIDTAYFESLLVHGQYENAMKLLEKYDNVKPISFGITLDKARCSKLMGNTDKAAEFFDAAYKLAANNWRRKTVELERDSHTDINESEKS